jgi:hypothetical protein
MFCFDFAYVETTGSGRVGLVEELVGDTFEG